MTDPRNLSQPTDDERRAADVAAQVRIHRDHAYAGGPTPDTEPAREHAAVAPEPDPRDLDEPTENELRAAEAASRVRGDWRA